MKDEGLIKAMIADFKAQRPDATDKEITILVAIDFANYKLQQSKKYCLCGGRESI